MRSIRIGKSLSKSVYGIFFTCMPLFIGLAASGCSPSKMVSRYADSAAKVFADDNDPNLVADALPFAIKLTESLCAADPGNPGYELAAARLISSYAHAFVLGPADTLADTDYEAATTARLRASGLFIRGRDHAFAALEHNHCGLGASLRAGDTGAVRSLRRGDSAALYWTIAAWLSAAAADRSNIELTASLSTVRTLVAALLRLAPDYGDGSFHELLISFYGGLPGELGGSEAAARRHYALARALRKGRESPSVFIALAASVSLKKGDRSEFAALLDSALAVNPAVASGGRLAALLAQKRAERLRLRIDDLFLPAEVPDSTREGDRQ